MLMLRWVFSAPRRIRSAAPRLGIWSLWNLFRKRGALELGSFKRAYYHEDSLLATVCILPSVRPPPRPCRRRSRSRWRRFTRAA